VKRTTLYFIPFALCVPLLCVINSPVRCQDSVAHLQNTAPATTDSGWIVGQIIIVGNDQTKDFVILREMGLQPGAIVTPERLTFDQNRIYSLGLFNKVSLHLVPSSEPKTTDIIVEVSERWYIFPYPIIGIKDHDWDKLYYGIGLMHANFRGRNEKLYLSLGFGYDPWIALSYRNPFLLGDGGGTYFLESSLTHNTVRNKSVLAQDGGTVPNFDERHSSIYGTLGRRMGIEHTVWCMLGYEVVSVSDYRSGRTLSPSGTDHFPVFGLGYSYDTRDLAEYPSLGSLARLSVTKYGLPDATLDLVRYGIDLRHYQPIVGRLVWTSRAFANLAAAGPTPSYNRVYLGYGDRIRGHFNEVYEGESITAVSTELHLTVLPVRYFTVGVLPPQFGVWKFGIVAAAFADGGTVWFRNEPFAMNRFVKGYGIGLDFLLPYSAVLQTECAWNEARRGEFILDVGTTF
jgi:outer membrane protein assembly factor BamA